MLTSCSNPVYSARMKTKLEEREKQLEALGFTYTRVGMQNEKYALQFHYIDELSEEDFTSFINDVKKENV